MNREPDESGPRSAGPVDFIGHIRSFIGALPVAVVIGVLVGAVVYGVGAATVASDYRVQVVAQVVPSVDGGVTADNYTTFTAPYVALSTDSDVLLAAAQGAGLTLTPEETSKRVTVADSGTPLLLDISATDSDQATAQKLALSMVTAMNKTYAARSQSSVPATVGGAITNVRTAAAALTQSGAATPAQSALFSQRLDQLNSAISGLGAGSSAQSLRLLAVPAGGGTKAGTSPVMLALVVGLAAVLVAAELIVWLRSRRGTAVNREWLRRAAREYDGLVVDIAERGDLALPLGTGVAVRRIEEPESALVLVSPGASDAPVPPLPNASVIPVPLGNEWWEERDDYGLAVVEVVEGERIRPELNDALAQLSAAGIPTRLAVLHSRGRTAGTPFGLSFAFRNPGAGGSDDNATAPSEEMPAKQPQ